MEWKRILKHLKIAVIAGAVFLTGFSLECQDVNAVGIYVEDETDGGTGTDVPAEDGISEGESPSGEDAAAGGTSESTEGTPRVAGGNPSAPWLLEVGTGEKDLYDAMIERKLRVADTGSPTSLQIEHGNIVLAKDGKYTQKDGTTDTAGEFPGELTIAGYSGDFNITVESGNPVIHVNGLSVNMSDGVNSGSGIYIKSGASVTLVLGEDETSFTGSGGFSGITLEAGATLNVIGKGKLNVVGGEAAFGISGSSNTKGGKFSISDEAEFRSYSAKKEGAFSADVMASSKKVLQGTLLTDAKAPAGDADAKSIRINVENRDNPAAEKYPIDLPVGYRSFATSTTAEGGYYISYYPYPDKDGGIYEHRLLANNQSPYQHTFDLRTKLDTFASIKDMEEREIKYNLTFHANEGVFTSTNTMRETIEVGYGDTIELPKDDAVKRENHTVRGWYRILNSIKEEERWKPANRVVQNGIILYATWKPDKCKVKYRSGSNIVKEAEYPYESAIPDADKWPGPATASGKSIAYWTGPDGEKWIFDKGGTTNASKLLQETTILDAVWLADCKVTFLPNAGDEKVDGWPVTTKTQATSTITNPSETRALIREKFRHTDKWYKDEACTEDWDFLNDTVVTDMVLYAGWGAEETRVIFNVDHEAGEDVNHPDIAVPFRESIDDQHTEIKATKPFRDGDLHTNYILQGWYTQPGGKGEKWDFTGAVIDADGILNLYPYWVQETYWAVMQPGDESAEPQKEIPLDVTEGGDLNSQQGERLTNLYEKEGYKIVGWRNAKTGQSWDLNTVLTEDITLSALWERATYRITFETPADSADSGMPAIPENQKSRSIAYNSVVDAPKYGTTETPWPGHTFHGWYEAENPDPEKDKGKRWKFSDEAGADTMPARDVTLYACWTRDEYTVSFHTYTGDEGEKIPPQSPLFYGAKVKKPAPDPKRSHYEFLGWYKDKELREQWDFDADTVTGDMMLRAGWDAHPLKVFLHVEYEPDNEDHPEQNVDITFPGNVFYGDYLDKAELEKLEETTARPGYTLNGWYTDEYYTEEGRWDFANKKAEPGDEVLHLYAYWSWDEYTVDFSTWEGDSQVPPAQGIRYGQTVQRPEPDPVRTHYTFDNWYADLNAQDKVPWDFDKNEVTGNMTLYADWTPKTYTLSFETNGGSALAPVEVTYGEHVSLDVLNTKKAGYTFAGWYKDSGLTQPFAPETDYVEGNMTIYAGWELEKYTVTFHFRESEDSTEEELITYKKAYHAGDYLTKPDKKVPHKTLSNWYTSPGWNKENQWVFKRNKVEGDTDLYAYWSDTIYKVHFETSGGTAIDDMELAWGSQPEQPADPVHQGGTFAGWYKDSEYVTPWDFEEDFIEGDTVIYAKWNYTMCTVTFDTDEGLPVPDMQVVPYGSLITEPAAPEKEGFTFKGWMSNGASANWDFAADTASGDMVLTAQWEPVVPGPADPEDPANPEDPSNPEDPAAPQDTTGGGDSTTTTPTSSGTNTGSGTGTGSGTDNKDTNSNKELTDVANELKKILTGDKAPLTYLLTGIFVSAAVIIGILRKKYRR